MAVDRHLIARLRESAEDFPPHPDDDLLPAQRLMGHVLAYGRLRHLAAAHVDDHPGESEAYGLAAAMLLEQIAALVAETLPERVTEPAPLVDPHPAGTIVRDRSDALWRRSDEGYWHHQSGLDALRWDGLNREYGPLLVVSAASGRDFQLDAEPAEPAELVDEPGPEVAEVYDRAGDRWERSGADRSYKGWIFPKSGALISWRGLRTEYGPLTLTPPATGGEQA